MRPLSLPVGPMTRDS